MTIVQLAAHISHMTGAPQECEANGTTIADLVQNLDHRYPGLARFLIQDNGALRQQIEILIDDRPIGDREKLMDSIQNARVIAFRQTDPSRKCA